MQLEWQYNAQIYLSIRLNVIDTIIDGVNLARIRLLKFLFRYVLLLHIHRLSAVLGHIHYLTLLRLLHAWIRGLQRSHAYAVELRYRVERVTFLHLMRIELSHILFHHYGTR